MEQIPAHETTTRLWLRKHVYVCRRRRHVILLDLRRDTYLGLAAEDADSLAGSIVGWTTSEGSQTLSTPIGLSHRQGSEPLIRQLLGWDMVTQNRHWGKAATPANIPLPDTALIDGYPALRADVTFPDLARFAIASWLSFFSFKLKSLERIAADFKSRRETQMRRTARSEPFDLTAARRHVMLFARLRPLAFTATNACLFDSLALAEFLARAGLFPNWIFGVTTEPFAAHCWLQHQNVVINDTPSYVCRYTPIMVL
jgi:hypothetical protein